MFPKDIAKKPFFKRPANKKAKSKMRTFMLLSFMILLLCLIEFCYSQTVSTLAGSTLGFIDASGTNAQFRSPFGIAVDTSGNVYVADQNNHRIRKITPAGVATTFAGSSTAGTIDAVGTNAQFWFPQGLGIDSEDKGEITYALGCREAPNLYLWLRCNFEVFWGLSIFLQTA